MIRLFNRCFRTRGAILRGRCVPYSTSTAQIGRKKPEIRELIKAPIFKSIFLTLVFGSAVIDLMKNRRELESLIQTYNSKFIILEEIISKLERGENVDINQELKIANTLTKYKYNTVTDIELDEQLDRFLKMAEEVEVPKVDEKEQKLDEAKVAFEESRPSIETKKFL